MIISKYHTMRYAFLILSAFISTLYIKGDDIESPIVIEHIGLRDGLSNNFVTAIAQDQHGFIWIGTEAGLNRFDGENFKLFSERNTALEGNSINALFYDDRTDMLWIGSKKGLNVLDCRTGRFEDPELPQDLGILNVVDFGRAADGGIYIVNHYDFILHCNTTEKQYTVYRQEDLPGLPMTFRSIADDGQGNLYIGHANYGFSVVNLKQKKITSFIHETGNRNSLPGNNVKDILIDRYKNIWLGTDCGLALFNPGTGTFSTFSHDSSGTGALDTHNVYSIMESDNGLLWIGSDIGGVCILDIRDLSLSNPHRLKFTILSSNGDRNGISSVNVHSVFQDTFGNIWIGNYSEGLDFISRTQPEFSLLPYFSTKDSYVREKPVWTIYSDNEDNVWAGGENEVVLFADSKIKRIYNLSSYLKSTRGNICALIRTGDELLLSSFEDGIFSLNVNSGNVRRISAPGDRNYANSYAIIPDNTVLLGMQDGLFEYSGGEIRKLEKISAAISNLIPNGIAVDPQGKLWIGTYGNGVFIFDREGNVQSHLDNAHGLCSNAVKQLYIDSRGWMWIAGQDGLSLVRDTDQPLNIVNYDYDSGLNDIHIKALQEDAKNNIWFSTNIGLSKWNKDNSKIENYDYHDGLPHSSFMDRAACRTADGNLYFGSLNGICMFRPEHFPNIEERIPIQIVECQSIVTPQKDIDNILTGMNGDREIRIPYDMNSLRILFSVPDYSQSRIVEYAYTVEGLDNDWIMAGREHEALLRNLAPGRYIFKVRARMRNQDWSDSNISVLKIIVTPPIWLTWYAKLFYILVIIGIVYIVIRVYKHRLLLKNSLEMERRKSIDDQQLNNERLRFYTNITHELRTPLTLILGPLEDLVTDRQLPDTYKKRIKTIHSSALRLLNLINQILEFRKTETQNRRLAVAKGQIAPVVMEIGLRYKELNHNEKVSISLNINNNIPDIYFDSDIIHTILNNLLSNAMKYTPEGSIELSLGQQTVNDEHFVEIAVADTGYGIDEKALPHIFDRYYQADGKHQASGTGIGLALVRSLSDLHEGSLSVDSKIGKGTVFTFRLKTDNTYPEALHKENTKDKPAEIPEHRDDENPDRQPVVLVVEDNDDIREYIESSLQAKYQVHTATNGQEGADLAKKYIPDVIISDIMMPVMDGMELCRIIKEDIRTSHIPVILLTAKDSIQDKEAGYEIGADSYLTKPFSARLLISRIHNMLESRKLLASVISSHVKGEGSVTDTSVIQKDDAKGPAPVLRLSRLDEEFIHRFTRIVEDNLTLPELDMSYMQDALNMSHSTLYRKIKSLTGMSGNEFIRKIRLTRGHELLNDGYNVSEAAYSCGFNDIGYFRNCFKDEYGMSPSQFIKRLSRQ